MDQVSKETKDEPETSGSSHTKNELPAAEDETEKPLCNEAELDITSEYFNPLKALYSPDFRVTEKKPKILYQNMAAFETALKKVGIVGLNTLPKNSEASGSKGAKTQNAMLVKEEKIQRRFQDHQMPIQTQPKVKSRHKRNLLTQMAQSEGPFKKLQQFVNDGQTVKVLVRREHGIKGYVEGTLKMFDRHWNMLLVDVKECLVQRKYKFVDDKLVTHQLPADCSHILQNLGITLPKQCVKSLGRKRVEIKRHLPQILLRGEHVVLISDKVACT